MYLNWNQIYTVVIFTDSSRNNYDVACPMNFKNYPYDTQICKVKYESCKFPFWSPWNWMKLIKMKIGGLYQIIQMATPLIKCCWSGRRDLITARYKSTNWIIFLLPGVLSPPEKKSAWIFFRETANNSTVLPQFDYAVITILTITIIIVVMIIKNFLGDGEQLNISGTVRLRSQVRGGIQGGDCLRWVAHS